jgi:hypothetical protein
VCAEVGLQAVLAIPGVTKATATAAGKRFGATARGTTMVGEDGVWARRRGGTRMYLGAGGSARRCWREAGAWLQR